MFPRKVFVLNSLKPPLPSAVGRQIPLFPFSFSRRRGLRG